MNKQRRVNFAALVQKRKEQQIRLRELQIVGGEIAVDRLPAWLEGWHQLDLRWRLWEEISAMALEERTLPADVTYLERGRLFGAAGDLSLRRDGARFFWWFVGDPNVPLPTDHGGQSFWADQDNAQKTFSVVTEQAILWGAYQGDDHPYWYDDRVGYADLDYPASLHGKQHVYAQYREYLDGGRVAAVWMYDLVGNKEDEANGNG